MMMRRRAELGMLETAVAVAAVLAPAVVDRRRELCQQCPCGVSKVKAVGQSCGQSASKRREQIGCPLSRSPPALLAQKPQFFYRSYIAYLARLFRQGGWVGF